MSKVESTATPRSRRGARSALRDIRKERDVTMLPALKRKLPLVEPISREQIEKIDSASMDILKQVGVVFREPIALYDWKKSGADVRGETIHFDRGLIRELINTIPPSFTYHERNSDNNLPFEQDYSIFVPMTGAPFIVDLENKRRWRTLNDQANFHKMPKRYRLWPMRRWFVKVVWRFMDTTSRLFRCAPVRQWQGRRKLA
jgi:trimethylamine--corrinoid protein Co-methyltransferase